jgi:hypothetical protein
VLLKLVDVADSVDADPGNPDRLQPLFYCCAIHSETWRKCNGKVCEGGEKGRCQESGDKGSRYSSGQQAG